MRFAKRVLSTVRSWSITTCPSLPAKRNMTYKVNPEATTMNLAVRSLYLISNRVELTEDEAQAIVAHDGIYPVPGGVNNLDYHHRECRLQMIVHFADKWTAAVDEEGRT